MEWMLKKKKAGFQAASMISIALACIGVLGAVICDFGFNECIIAFCVACIGFVLAVCCQLALYILAKSTVKVDGLSNEKVKSYFQDLKCITKNTCCVVLLYSVLCLPLAAYFYVVCANIWSCNLFLYDKALIIAGNWFKYGSILTGLCLVGIIWINAIVTRDHIKFKYISRFTIMGVITFLLFSFIMYIPPYWISEGDTVKSYSDFVMYMKHIPEAMSDGKVQLLTRDENFIERL